MSCAADLLTTHPRTYCDHATCHCTCLARMGSLWPALDCVPVGAVLPVTLAFLVEHTFCIFSGWICGDSYMEYNSSTSKPNELKFGTTTSPISSVHGLKNPTSPLDAGGLDDSSSFCVKTLNSLRSWGRVYPPPSPSPGVEDSGA